MERFLTILVILMTHNSSWGAYANFNSVLIGEQAAGMGGAYTALSGDSAATPFYNPASTVRINGNSISASATIFNKFDTTYGEDNNLITAGERVNRGFFRTIPSAFSSIYKWNKWAFGLSIVVPDYDFFSGNIADTSSVQSFLSYTDESLWSGVTASYEINKKHSLGVTVYYTARSLIRSVNDRVVGTGTQEIITTEEKSVKHNGLLFVLGYLYNINSAWSLGVSIRPPALRISGQGSYYKSVTDTDNLPSQITQFKNTKANTYIPPKATLGMSYKPGKNTTLSLDGSLYGHHAYRDINDIPASDLIEHKETYNIALGFEQKFEAPKFSWRAGLFTNNPSHPQPIGANPTNRTGDHLKLFGISSNIAFYTSENVQFSLGGFYVGGKGQSVQLSGNQFVAMDKNHHLFSLLIGSSYHF